MPIKKMSIGLNGSEVTIKKSISRLEKNNISPEKKPKTFTKQNF
jgi:hypothetical protein